MNVEPYYEDSKVPEQSISKMLDSFFESLDLESIYGATEFSDREIWLMAMSYIAEACTEILSLPDNLDLSKFDEESRKEMENKIRLKEWFNHNWNFAAYIILRSWRYSISQGRKSMGRKSREEVTKISLGARNYRPEVSLSDKLKAMIGRGDFKKESRYVERK